MACEYRHNMHRFKRLLIMRFSERKIALSARLIMQPRMINESDDFRPIILRSAFIGDNLDNRLPLRP